jgi:hypothetical protein
MESSIGHDLSAVRLHTGSVAERASESLDARGFTIGTHVALGRGQSPTSDEGRRTLAHELAHVVQQGRGGRSGGAGELESDATGAAEKVAAGQAAEISRSSAVGVALDAKKRRRKAGAGKGTARAATPKGGQGSASYTEAQLRGSGSTNWPKERRRHTRRADREASKAASVATGKPRKVTGKGVEYHHHADVKEAKRLNLNPDVAGEKERMSAVKSHKDKRNYGQVGDRPGKGEKLTHHNTAKAIDKAEQERTARAIRDSEGKAPGQKPKLPKGGKGRAGLVDASGTSKWRWPATADQAERAKEKWVRRPPVGPPVDRTGRVITPSTPSKPPATPPSSAAPVKPPAAGPASPTLPPNPPPAPTAARAPGPAATASPVPVPKAGVWSRLGRFAGMGSRVLGAYGQVTSTVSDVLDWIAEDKPEWLPQNKRIQLMKPDPKLPFFKVPTGYSIERQGDKIIYRDSEGNEVPKSEAEAAMKGHISA